MTGHGHIKSCLAPSKSLDLKTKNESTSVMVAFFTVVESAQALQEVHDTKRDCMVPDCAANAPTAEDLMLTI